MTRISPEMFRATASNPVAWRQKAITLREAAESLWDSFNSLFLKGDGHLLAKDKQSEVLDRFAERIHTSQLLYGLATETALKARIIALDATKIELRERKDENGKVIDLQIHKIGVELGKDGHDLVKLADAAGVLNPTNTALFPVESDFTTTRAILEHLTDCVRWSGRYPAPKKLSEIYIRDSSVPGRALGLYLRDWLDPFLDALLDESRPPPPSS